MFTGIASDIGIVQTIEPRADNLRRITITCSYPRASIADGASIACSGVCLTVTGAGEKDGRTWFSVDAAAETLGITTVGSWKHGTRINLERALKLGDEFGGHMVAGHIDGLAVLTDRQNMTDMADLTFQAPAELMRFFAPKGSVALDGVSLTINRVAGDGFSVLVIPHTLQVTTFGGLRPGDRVNLEVDTLARYAARLAEVR